tara:strand:+ start:710 stop:1210 length:501 start_codon:yes stop_codon:yes gene_type:complete
MDRLIDLFGTDYAKKKRTKRRRNEDVPYIRGKQAALEKLGVTGRGRYVQDVWKMMNAKNVDGAFQTAQKAIHEGFDPRSAIDMAASNPRIAKVWDLARRSVGTPARPAHEAVQTNVQALMQQKKVDAAYQAARQAVQQGTVSPQMLKAYRYGENPHVNKVWELAGK